MKKLAYNAVHFIGIGGVGMSGIATILHQCGVRVTGSDLVENPTISGLKKAGVEVQVGQHQTSNLPQNCDLVIFSSAVTAENPEMVEANKRGIPTIRRGLFLAELGQHFPFTIAVSGSHGKTTTTAMLVHIFKSLGHNPAYMVGGTVATWPASAGFGDGKIFITEIDESDGTQRYFKPDVSVILNVEDDHAWSAGGQDQLFESFREVAQNSSKCFAWADSQTKALLEDIDSVHFVAEIAPLTVPQLGQHNLLDATMALHAAVAYGLDRDAVVEALTTFPGVKRRMTKHGEDLDRNLLLIEDYAHHPTELACFYDAMREMANGRQLAIIFQPHRYERIKRYHQEFSEVLAKFDKVALLAPFAAWRKDQDLADPRLLLEKVDSGRCIYWQEDFTNLPEFVTEFFPSQDVVISVVGAGDISKLVEPLIEALGL